MKASIFVVFVVLVYISALAIGYAVILSGYGMPERYVTYYMLDSLGLMYGLAKQYGSSLVYEWTVTGLLKPGNTTINIGLFDQEVVCPDGRRPVEITVSSEGVNRTVSGSDNITISVERSDALLVVNIRVAFNTSMCGINTDRVGVYVDALVAEEK